MAWTKAGQLHTAAVTNTSLKAKLYYSDANAVPSGALRIKVWVTATRADNTVTTETADLLVSDHVTGGTDTFNAGLASLRDAALTALGYTEA